MTFQVTKIFGVNYDIENTRRSEMDNTMSQYSPSINTSQCTRRPPPLPPPPNEAILNTQTAILANQHGGSMGSNNSSSQHINILALARSRNNLDQAAMMSHTSTIDSLELFATIRENCALVPSYSEALLLTSVNNQTNDALTRSMVLNSDTQTNTRHVFSRRKSLDPNQRIAPSTSNSNPETRIDFECQSNHQSTIIGQNTPKRKLRIVEEHRATNSDDNCSNVVDDSDEDFPSNSGSPLRIHATQSNYSLKTNNNYILMERDKNGSHYKWQNRKSWAGFLSKPNHFSSTSRGHGSARIRPIPLLSCRKNSLTDSLLNQGGVATTSNEMVENRRNSETAVPNDVEMAVESTLPISQIESIDRNLLEEDEQEAPSSNLYFASPLMKFCPADPFGGRVQTTPTEDPPPYDVAVNLPVFRRITRSVTDRGELFGQSRAFINDTLLNRRSCVDNVVSGTDAVRLLENSLSTRSKADGDVETNL